MPRGRVVLELSLSLRLQYLVENPQEEHVAFIDEKNAKVVRDRLSRLSNPVTLAIFTQELECEYCRHTRELAEEVASLSGGKVTTAVFDFVADKAKADQMGVDKIPALAVLGPKGEDYGIRFFGIPAGYEFASLLESLELVASGDSGLSPATREKLKGVSSPLDLKVFVTPTCPYCPRAVMTAFRFAVESKNVSASMVEATEFPQLANKYQVSGVPHTVLGESPQPMVGAYPETAAVDMLLAAVNGQKAM
jgi:glutaredoxin-like protein